MSSLLSRVKVRQTSGANVKGHRFGYGIQTADSFVGTVRECVGSDLCYRYAAAGGRSFEDVMRKAAKTLVYAAPGMRSAEVVTKAKEKGLVLPKNTLMVFRHRLTSPRKDRDGDILRSEGAQLDKNMLLLWQHIPTLPIGKLLKIDKQDEKSVDVISCIIDMNELSHDSAVMVDNGMARFSHGFKALDWSEVHDDKSMPPTFDVKQFEVMEESLVSVPSNVDANVQEVVLSLVEGGKLTSPIMKEFGKSIRSKRPKRVSVPRKIGDDGGKGKTACTCGKGGAEGTGTPKEAKTGTGKSKRRNTEGRTNNKKVGAGKGADGVCPKCGVKLNSEGACPKCGGKKPPKATQRERITVRSSMEYILGNASDSELKRFESALRALNKAKAVEADVRLLRSLE